MNPKISVIIPVYNTAQYLRHCLDSIIEQTLTEIEIICIYDKSNDNSLDILREYEQKDGRVNIIVCPVKKGVSAARNMGIIAAQGEYIGFVDSDDYLEEDFYENLYAHAEDVDIVKGYRKNGNAGKIDLFHNDKIKEYKTNFLFEFWTAIYKSTFLKSNSLFFDEDLIAFEDPVFAFHASIHANELKIVDNAIYIKVDREDSLSRKNNLIKYVIPIYKGIEKIFDIAESHNIDKKSNAFVACFLLGNYFSSCGDYGNATVREYVMKQTVKLFNRARLMISKYLDDEFKKCYPFLYDPLTKNDKEKMIGLYAQSKRNAIFNNLRIADLRKRIYDQRESEKSYSVFLNTPVRPNTILVAEPNNCHAETMVGYAKYLLDLGYNVDILQTRTNFLENAFCRFHDSRINFFLWDPRSFGVIPAGKLNQYKAILLNSLFTFSDKNFAPNYMMQEDFENNFEKGKIIYIEHEGLGLKKEKKGVFTLNDFSGRKMINPHYFGNTVVTPKNETTTNFISVGSVEQRRKNHNLLLNAVRGLQKTGRNFKVTLVGRLWGFTVPDDLLMNIDIRGRLSFSEMYEAMEKADFYLTLLDPDNPEHERYITDCSSGSIQLIYGFAKPAVIHKKFAVPYRLTGNNSIVYSNNFVEAMYLACDISAVEYRKKQENLQTVAKDIEKESWENLSYFLKDIIV
jgi:glycosyltransferase involved in cell wall biosynthesis